MTDKQTRPYISFIVTSRNDNHGGDLLCRMQIFVNCLIEQCSRYKLNSGIFEWNPPEDRPHLVDTLQWPANNKYCAIRIIEVPQHIHNTLNMRMRSRYSK